MTNPYNPSESFVPTDNQQNLQLSNSIPGLYEGLPQLSANKTGAGQSAFTGTSVDFSQHGDIYVGNYSNANALAGSELPQNTHLQNASDGSANTTAAAQASVENTAANTQAPSTGDSTGSSNLQQELATILTDLTQILQQLEGGGAGGGSSGGSGSGGDSGGGCGMGSNSGSGGETGTGSGSGSGSGSTGGDGGTSTGGGGSDNASMSIFNTLSNNPNFSMGNPFGSQSESSGDLQALQQLQQASGLSDSQFESAFNGAFTASGINNEAQQAMANAAADGDGQPEGIGDPLNNGFASLSNALSTVQAEDPQATGTQLVTAVANELSNEDNQAWQSMWGSLSTSQADADIKGNGINNNPTHQGYV